MKNQLVECQKWFSALFINTFGKALPYINAVLMVIKELCKWLGTLFGIEISDYNSSVASYSDDYDDLSDSVDDATDSVKELKRQTLGFDQINNINEDTDSDSDSGSSIGGIDQRLLDAITGYDNGMESVRMKATEIRDKIMEWLGFTKEVNEETNAISWSYTRLDKDIEEEAKKISETFANSLNKNIEKLDTTTFAKRISTYINGGLIAVNTFIDTYKWDLMASKLTDGVNVMLENIKWNEVGATFTNKAKILITFLSGVFTTLDWGELGTALADGVNGALENIPTNSFIEGFNALSSGIFKALKEFFKELDWGEFGSSIVEVLTGLSWESYVLLASPLILKGLGSGFSTLKGKITKKISSIFTKNSGLDSASESIVNFSIPSAKDILKGMEDLAIIIGGAEVLVTAVGAFNSIPYVKDFATTGIESLVSVFNGILKIIVPLSGLSVLTTLMSKVKPGEVATGLADLGIIIIAGMETILTVTGALLSIEAVGNSFTSGLQSMIDMLNGLAEICTPLIVLTVGVTGLGAVMSVLGGTGYLMILEGLGALGEVILGFEGVLAIVGAINSAFNLQDFVSGGGEVLCQLATIMGNVAGSIIAGFADKAMDSIDDYGTHLSNFMTNAKPFFDALSGIDSTTLDSIKNLASGISEITATSVLDGIYRFITGKSSIAEFGKQLPDFGKNIKKYSDNIKGIDSSLVTESANASKSLAEFSKNIPNQGGLVSLFTGDNTIDKFSEKLPKFGTNLKKYSDNIKGIDASIVETSANAGKSISKLASSLPNSGGLASLFTGDNSIDKFGTKLKKFGESFKEYYDNIKEISLDKVNNVTTAIKSIVDLAQRIKDNGLSSTMKDFGKSLETSKNGITTFFNNTFSTTNAKTLGWDFGTTLGDNIKSGLKNRLSTTIKVSSGWDTLKSFKVSAYANGGFPEDGLFFANHSELVGQFANGKTAVANNEQILEGIKQGVKEAILETSGTRSQAIKVYASDGVIVEKAITGINNITKQTGECPIEVW